MTHIINQLQQKNIDKKYNLNLKKILTIHNSTKISYNQNKSLLQQPFTQLNTNIKYKKFNTTQKHI